MLTLATLAVAQVALAQPVISEVYPSTPEWVEIWNAGNEVVNLAYWNISDNSTEKPDTITCYAVDNCSLETNATYFLLLGRNTNISQITNESVVYFYVDDQKIGNGLTDGGDALLFYNSSYSSSMNYNSSAVGKSWAFFDGNWGLCSNPTPGGANACGTENAPQKNASSTLPVCDLAISISSPSTVNLAYGNALEYKIAVSDVACEGTAHNVTVTYSIDDLFGGNVRPRVTSSQSMSCSAWEAKRSWSSWPEIIGSEAYIIKANITEPGCNDTNILNNYAERMIAVIENSTSRDADSNVSIVAIAHNGNGSMWGESLDVWLEIYKGDTQKYAVNVYVKGSGKTSAKVSEETTVHANAKHLLYKLRVPVRLKPNCGGEWPDGTYTLVAEGLDRVVTKDVNISGISMNACQAISSAQAESVSGTSKAGSAQATVGSEEPDFYFVFAPDEVAVGEAFDVTVGIKNQMHESVTYALYSYVSKGSQLISEGLSENGAWKGVWDGNRRDIKLTYGGSSNITLTNRIKSDSQPGIYTLRVRIKGVEDLTKSINVIEATSPKRNVTGKSTPQSEERGESQPRNATTRRTITREDPLDALRSDVGKAFRDFSNSASIISAYVVERMPETDPFAAYRLAARLWEAFISGITHIIRS